MEALNALLAGFGVALDPMNLLWGFVGCMLGTAVGVLPGVGPAVTIALLLPLTQARADRRADHVRRHLLRRDVRRLDDDDPAQHAGRIGVDRRPRSRATDGEDGPRRPGARDGGDRLVRRRHDRDDPRRRCSRRRWSRSGSISARRTISADGVRLHDGGRGARHVHRARAHQPVPRPVPRPDRHRQPDRPGPLRVRRAGAARRRRRRRRRGRALRGRRDALCRGLPEPRRRRLSRR